MMGQVTAAHRALVQARDRTCAGRGVIAHRCGGHLDAGHIVGRGMGGTPQGDRFDSPAWVVLHCRNLNGLIESDPDVRTAAESAGQHQSYHRAKQSPRGALVQYADGWFYLDAEGGRTPLGSVPLWEVS